MKKYLLFLLFYALCSVSYAQDNYLNDSGWVTIQNTQSLETLFKEQKSGVQVEGSGKVVRILSDDNKGNRHQRFILRLETGQTILIAHNIDIAPRIPSLKPGETIKFYGVYEWNQKGGIVHWTHHDPINNHIPGWLKRNGKTYQ